MRLQSAPSFRRPTLRWQLASILTALGLCSLVPCYAAAGVFSDLIVFGDSLSDVGNVEKVTTMLSPLVPPTPGPSYYAGRFSDGPIYAEVLATGLGLGPLTASLDGGDDFAYGGALTSGTPFPRSVVVQDLDDQVDQYLASRTPDPAALFLVYGGADDVLNQLSAGSSNVEAAANNLATDIADLYTAGARKFLVPNLPALGLTPTFNDNPAEAANANYLTSQFNASLAAALDALEAARPDLTIFRLDVATLFGELVANPAAFGLKNVTDPAAPGLEPGDQNYDSSQAVANPEDYLFWDELHPTTAAHALLGERALLLVPEPDSILLLTIGILTLARGRRRSAEAALRH